MFHPYRNDLLEDTMNLTTATPVEIDTELARIYAEFGRLAAQHAQALKTVEYYTKGRRAQDRDAASSIARYQDRADQIALQIDSLNDEAQPFNNEFARRGGWTRAFLVNNSNGHVHRDMSCSTCFLTTDYVWMVNYSGHDEAEIVADAGERACTVCYPSAPVEILSRPTKMFTPTEVEAQARRDELAAKRSAKESAKVIDPKTGKELFKTVRGATNEVASLANSAVWYSRDGHKHPSHDEWIAQMRTILVALEAKGEVEDAEKALKEAIDKQIAKYPAVARKSNKEAVARGYNKMEGYQALSETHPGVQY